MICALGENKEENMELKSKENIIVVKDTETVDKVTTSKRDNTCIGVVTECIQLRVRETPDASKENTIGVLTFADEVLVDLKSSTTEFYKVITSAGVEGYCMKKFINIKQGE
jgi:hypothetical protein